MFLSMIVIVPMSNDNLSLYVLQDVGSKFREITAPIHAWETSFAFEELHDTLVGHETLSLVP